MSALKLVYQSVCRIVSLGVCSASEEQAFGISVQWDLQKFAFSVLIMMVCQDVWKCS